MAEHYAQQVVSGAQGSPTASFGIFVLPIGLLLATALR